MRDLHEHLRRRTEPFALATVLDTRGNTPRPPGTAMAVTAEGAVHGAVSGGCVDAEVHRLCLAALGGAPPRLLGFGYVPDDPFAIGLSCDGAMEVFVQRVDPSRDEAASATLAALTAGRAVALTRIVRGPEHLIGRGLAVDADGSASGEGPADPVLRRRIIVTARAMLAEGSTGARLFPRAGDAAEVEVFVESLPAPPRLLIFGAVDFAAALSETAALLGYRVTVCDARPLFTRSERFPAGTELVTDWPHRYLATTETGPDTVVCDLTHDPKFSVPLLAEALRRPLAYVGALGSRGSSRRRAELLTEAGVGATELAALHAPIGLDLGGRTPQETALSIMAEVVAVRHGRTGRQLSSLTGALHRKGATA
ncbi:XdhC family protein [Phytomonospora sp. NPDC050363]|uniref:XdhC family protein n=1 Tax=Phytomonospora sp. NPDC050363 TaxID=3155642 RepID=UPI003410B674